MARMRGKCYITVTHARWRGLIQVSEGEEGGGGSYKFEAGWGCRASQVIKSIWVGGGCNKMKLLQSNLI